MAAFYAELIVAGRTYPVRSCTYEFTQATDQRGRVVAKVRHGKIYLTMDVPTGEELLHWAATPHKVLAGHLAFFAENRHTVRESVSWEVGYCVGYQEEFKSGNDEEGAYVCHLVIASP